MRRERTLLGRKAFAWRRTYLRNRMFDVPYSVWMRFPLLGDILSKK
jgi:hypothetical protein